MPEDLPHNKKTIPISEAAKILEVSIDTVRRWDKEGVVRAYRPNGKDRYFSIEELERLKFSKPLTISEASEKLGISTTTLRRLEKKGLIKPERNGNGERVYDKETLGKFLRSEYFLRQKEVEEKILESLKEPKHEETMDKILGVVELETRQQVLKLNNFRKAFFASGIFIAITFILIISIITILFLLFPEDTAKFFGYRTSQNNPKVAIQAHQGQGAILGARAPNTETKQKVEALGAALKPLSRISLGIVKQINPKVYEKVVPTRVIEDVSDILTIDEKGNIAPRYNIKLPDSTYLQVSDKGLIKNLNAEWIRGKAPEDGEGDLVVYDGNNSTILNLRINSDNINDRAVVGGVGGIILDSSITSEDLANNAITTLKIADSAITSAKLASGVGGTPGDDSVTSAKIKDGEVKNADLTDAAVTSSKISDNTITATDIAVTLTFADGDFFDLAAVVHDDSAVQGLRLPNAASATPTVPTSGEGYIAWDTSGNQAIVYNGSSWSAIGSGLSADSVLESHLKAVDGATDEECLTYESAVGDFEWQSCGSGGSQTPWTSDIDADGFSLTDFGTNLTSRGALTIATTTTSALTLDSGTTGTVNLGTGNNAKTINIGTGTAGNTINIGTNNTILDTISIGSALDSLALTDADWSITTAGAATFSSVTEGGTALSAKYAPIGANFVTVTANGTLTGETGIDALTTAISTTSTLNADGATTLAALTLTGNLTLSGDASEGLDGGGLTGTDCDTAGTSKLLYDDTTNKFSCGTDQNSGGTTAWDAIADPAAGADILFNETAQTMTWNTGATAAAFDGLSIGITNDATTDSTTQRGLVVENLASTGSTTTESLIVADNQDTDETVTNGLLIEQSAAGTMTNAIQIAETAGTITDGILITGTLGNILNSGSIDITGDGAITGATGVTTTTLTATSTITADNEGIEFTESDTNPTCASGNFTIYADLSENKLKKCQNGTASDLDTTGTPTVRETRGNTAVTLGASEAEITSVSITPSSATADVWIVASAEVSGDAAANRNVTLRIRRGADCTATQIGVDMIQETDYSADDYINAISFVDNNPGASAQTYRLCAARDGGSPTVDAYSITVMEVDEGADLGEVYYSSDPTIGPGELVSIDPTIRSGVKRASKPYDQNLLGVVSTRPGLLLNGSEDSGVPVILALAGRVLVKVTTENGTIKPGDKLTSSSTTGVAMKSTKAGPVIGQAMSSFDGQGVGMVTMFVRTGYFTGAKTFDLLSDPESSNLTNTYSDQILAQLISQSTSLNSVNLSEMVTDRLTAGLEIITPRLVADEVIAKTIKAERIEGIEIMVGQISHLSDQIKSFDDLFAASNEAFASPSAILGDSSRVNTSSSALTSLTVDGLATISGQLKTGSLRVLGPALIEGVLSIIDTITVPRIIVTDLATFIGKTIFKDDVEFQGRPIFNKDTAGFAVIKKDTDVVDVVFEKEYSKIPVVNINITLDENTEDSLEQTILNGDVKYIVAKASIKGFKIKLNKKALEDIKFSWIATATKDSSVFESLNQTNVPPTPLEQSLTPTASTSASDASYSAEIQLDNINPSVQY